MNDREIVLFHKPLPQYKGTTSGLTNDTGEPHGFAVNSSLVQDAVGTPGTTTGRAVIEPEPVKPSVSKHHKFTGHRDRRRHSIQLTTNLAATSLKRDEWKRCS